MFKRIFVIFVEIGILGVGMSFIMTFPNLNKGIQTHIIYEKSLGIVFLKLD